MDPFVSECSARSERSGSVFRRRIIMGTRDGSSSTNRTILSAAWIIFGILTVVVPLVYRTIHKNKYREIYMSYYWEEEYQYYEEQRKELYETYGNSYNYGGANMYPDYYDEREYHDVNNCKWWQINCFSFFVNQDGQPMSDQQWIPEWYSGFSMTDEERMELENSLEQPASLKFVYVWQLIIFAMIVWYGTLVIRQNRNTSGLIVALVVWANFAFLSMWLMADGSIVTDGQQVKRTGFYGQVSVLIFMTNFWYFLHGLIFVIVFWIRASCSKEQEQRQKEERIVVQYE